jgi:hypothetical protein
MYSLLSQNRLLGRSCRKNAGFADQRRSNAVFANHRTIKRGAIFNVSQNAASAWRARTLIPSFNPCDQQFNDFPTAAHSKRIQTFSDPIQSHEPAHDRRRRGSVFTRAGYGGDSEPISVIQTVVGRPHQSSLSHTNPLTPAEVCIGAPVYKRAAQLSIRYPVENRQITNFDDFELLLSQLFLSELHVTIEKYPLLMRLNPSAGVLRRLRAAMSLYAAGSQARSSSMRATPGRP